MEQRLLEFRKRKAAQKVPDRKETSLQNGHEEETCKNVSEKKQELNQKLKADSSDEEEKRFKQTLSQQRKNLDSQWEKELSFWDKNYHHIENGLKFILWVCLLGFFIQLGFGAVYFVLSLIYVMYRSMRSGANRIGPSAYSVFNEGCERIQGTFTAEQFENQLRHGRAR